MKTLVKILGVVLLIVAVIIFNDNWMTSVGCAVIGLSFINVK